MGGNSWGRGAGGDATASFGVASSQANEGARLRLLSSPPDSLAITRSSCPCESPTRGANLGMIESCSLDSGSTLHDASKALFGCLGETIWNMIPVIYI